MCGIVEKIFSIKNLKEKKSCKKLGDALHIGDMARVAQLAEHLVVAQGAVGSSPAPRPIVFTMI